jgi:site-specific DNA-methyltransferase (adenine-specific)
MIGAAQSGRESLGIDINPLAIFAAKVKLRPLSERQIAWIRRFIAKLDDIERTSPPWELPALAIASKVFEPKILTCIRRLRTGIEELAGHDEALADFLRLGWIAVLETVGSYFKEGNGIKYRNKKRRKGTYVSRPEGEWQRRRFGEDQRRFVLNALKNQLATMVDDTRIWATGNWKMQRVMQGTAFDLKKVCRRSSFESIIFSPPYANRFDYFESFKVELWFGNFVSSYAELNALRKASLRSHLAADYQRATNAPDVVEELIDLMDRNASSWRMGVADLVRGYFHDLRDVLAQCKEVSPEARCHVVVGNSAFAGVIIPTDLLTAMIGMQVGYRRASVIEARHLTVAPQQRSVLRDFEDYMRESVVVLE